MADHAGEEDANFPFLNSLYKGLGIWHYSVCALLVLSQFQSAFSSMNILLIGFQPPFRCKITENVYNISAMETSGKCEVKIDNSNETKACISGFEYDGGKQVSFVAEWDLVCSNGYLAELSQTFFVIGMAVGASVASYIADKVGRKPVYMLTSLLLGLSCGAGAFVPSLPWYVVLRFLQGFFNLSMYDVKIVLIMELFPTHMRGTMIIIDGLMWGVCATVLAGLGYAFNGMNWRHVQLYLLPVYLVLIPQYFLLEESVFWLIANRKFKKAKRVLLKMARINGIDLTAVNNQCDKTVNSKLLTEVPKVNTEAHREKNPSSVPVARYSVCDIMRHRKTRFTLLGLCFVWFTNSLTYMGLFLMSTAMSGDRLLNVLLSAAVEIPAMGGLYLCVRWFGRRKGCIILHLACSISLLLAVVFTVATEGETNSIGNMVVCSIGKFAISASFILIYFYTPELLPTNFRATGLGITSGAARVGSVLSPFSTYVFREVAWVPGALFGSFCLLAAIFLIYVPETENKELPQNLEDIDNWEKNKHLHTEQPSEINL